MWLHFQRRINYHLANTYLPTITLLAIAELTMFYEQDMGVSLSLTILLVMYTFYQSISDSIPKTAYLKLLDYWLIFCLLVPFLIFLVQSYWRFSHNVSFPGIWTGSAAKGQNKSSKQPKKKAVQMMIVGITLAFTAVYFVAAVLIYYSQ